MEKLEALERYFGYSAFRPGQETLVDALLEGRDVLGVMPTGAGKSICYQLPALLLPGLTLVVSPLISLMADQVAALSQSGIPAAYLNSSLTPARHREVLRRAGAGAYKILYVAPERLAAPDFLALLEEAELSLVAVDEAHCISQWGQDFRPSYLKIASFLDARPRRPAVGAFTATATAEVKSDIEKLLGLRDPLRLTTGFDRPNLYFQVARPRDKDAWLRRFLARRPGESGIVYCATRKTVESLCGALAREGVAVRRYHAGLEDGERLRNQEDFLYDRARVMVATNAFGMGIDKSNISFVVHYNMPKSIEAYYQEAGRAGRDGEPARCALLFSPGDVQTAKFLITHPAENEALTPEEQAQVRRQELQRLEQMTRYCKTAGCLRAFLLRYFGQEAPERCGNCGSCVGGTLERDITVEAQKILSGVVRIEQQYTFGVGITLVIRMLRGSREQRVCQLGLDQLSTHGILKDVPRERIRAYIDCLLEEGYLYLTEDEYPVLRAAPRARQVLFRGERVLYRCPRPEEPEPAASASPAPEPSPLLTAPGGVREADGELLEALRALRTRLAREAGVPAYIIFSNAALADMARRQPETMLEFLEVSGVGQAKAQRYGQAFLAEIAAWRERSAEEENG